jgi:glycosyltransferase involved in cell wall biosynthesis
MTLASVIIPVYKVERYIAATVQSVLAQTYHDFEVIIVDDGSPDRSIQICQEFTDKRIKIIRQPNRGVCAARNTGINHAQGEYLAFIDGDDLWLPEKLEKHIEHLENSPNVGLSFSRSAFIDEAGKELGIYQMPKLTDITPATIICRNPIGNGSTPVIRREVLAAIKFNDNWYFDETLHNFEDVECWLRIALKTKFKVEGIPDALTLYRVNSKGASTNLAKQIENVDKVLDKTRSYAPDLIAKYGNAAKAYELRKLARWAVRLKAGSVAVKMAHQALSTYWRILIDEPRRTLITLAAAYLLFLIPQPVYQQMEALALRITGASQKRRILQEQSKQLA